MVLCIGTCAFVLIFMEMIFSLEARPEIQIDPARVIQAVIIGIGFLGAGTLIHKETHIKGATIGAGIWAIGSIGLACGLGFYAHAAIITLLVLIVVIGLVPLDCWLRSDKKFPALPPSQSFRGLTLIALSLCAGEPCRPDRGCWRARRRWQHALPACGTDRRNSIRPSPGRMPRPF